MQPSQLPSSINWPEFLGTLFLGAVVGYALNILTRTKYRQRLRDVPGGAVSLKTRFLDALGRPLQDFSPVDAIHLHLCGIDFPCGLPNNQVRKRKEKHWSHVNTASLNALVGFWQHSWQYTTSASA
jgi:hypothetical protein